MQASVVEFTQAGGLQAVEERLIAVQDFESKLEELGGLADTYQVSAGHTSLRVDTSCCSCSVSKQQACVGRQLKLLAAAASTKCLGDLKSWRLRVAELGQATCDPRMDWVHAMQAREDIFQLPHTEQALLPDIKRALEPFSALWRMAADCSRQLPDWMDGPFNEINAEAVATDVDKWTRSGAKLLKQLSGPPLEVVEAVRQQLQTFQQHIPLITALRNPGLRDRHWEKISAAVGSPVKADAGAGQQGQTIAVRMQGADVLPGQHERPVHVPSMRALLAS
jgi:hypothetical protein